jgi:hypothetical protein
MKMLVLYDSLGGNTEKVARRIYSAVCKENCECDIVKVDREAAVDIFDYELVFIGSPVIMWLPTNTMVEFVKKKMNAYHASDQIHPCAPVVPGRFAVCFCTYAGPHTGVHEAVPATKWLAAFMQHLGYQVLDEWHVAGAFHNNEEMSTRGRMGDLRGRPDDRDLWEVQCRVRGIIDALQAFSSSPTT